MSDSSTTFVTTFSLEPALLFVYSSSSLDDSGGRSGIKLRKKVLNKVSTKKEPCWNSQYETCHDIYDCKMIAEKYNCSISYLYSGAHMDHECYTKCEQNFQ